jgi:hypothetical protein
MAAGFYSGQRTDFFFIKKDVCCAVTYLPPAPAANKCAIGPKPASSNRSISANRVWMQDVSDSNPRRPPPHV